MSFAVSSLRVALGVPSTKLPVSFSTFASYVFPPLVCYILSAVLAITPHTRTARIALWIVTASLAFRAIASVDMSCGDFREKYRDVDFLISMLIIVVNGFSWMSAKAPLVRYLRTANSSPSIIMDALDLTTNLRGHGWNWSRGLHVPRDGRPSNRIAFVIYALVSGVIYALICGALSRAVYMFTGGDAAYSIFDETLPFFPRYLRSIVISIVGALQIYTILQMGYNSMTVYGVLLFRQDPAQWPPAFDNPWCATSLHEFWNRRWHQLFRHMFLLGAYPFYLVLGSTGTVIGAFLTSGVYHYVLLLPLGRKPEFWRLPVGFGMMASGMLAERAYYRLTGKRVGGVVGWIWTMTWLLLWGGVIIDACARGGLFSNSSFLDSKSPVRALVEKSVADFDTWLHTIHLR